jgi:hypothetical protein
MVLTCHVDSGANEGEWRWMRQNRYSAPCRLYKKKNRGNACIYPFVYFICFSASLPPSTTAAVRHLFRCFLYSATCWTIRVQFPAVDNVFFSCPKRPDRPGVLTSPLFSGFWGRGSPWIKRSEYVADHSYPSSAQV